MYSILVRAVALASVVTGVLTQSIDPDTVSRSTRDFWCQSQTTQCPLICTQENSGSAATIANDCDPVSLNYACVCNNGLSPNASEYSQTMPYFICTQYNSVCVENCGLSNNACAAACIQNHPCGAKNPTRVNVTATTSTTSATGGAKTTNSDGAVVYNGFGGAATTTASSKKNGASTARIAGMGEVYGLGLVMAGVFAGFTLLL